MKKKEGHNQNSQKDEEDKRDKRDERKSRDEHDEHDAEEIIAKELASKRGYSFAYSAKKNAEAHGKSNKKNIFCYIAVVAIVLLVVLSVASFFFSSFIQSPKEDFNKLTYRHYLEKIEDEKSRLDIVVDSLVSIEVAKIDSGYRGKKSISHTDSLLAKAIRGEVGSKPYLHSISESNREYVDSFTIPIKYDSRIIGLLQKHKVKRGETLNSISLLYYGSKDYSNFIFVYNRKQLFNPDNIRYGIVIDIPQIKGVDNDK